MKEKEIKTKAFLTYYDSEVMYQMLSDAEAGKLIKAMFRYCKDQEEVLSEKDGTPYAYFVVLKGQFDRDARKYHDEVFAKRKRDKERYERKKEKQERANGIESDLQSPLSSDQDDSNIIRLEGDNIWKWKAFQLHMKDEAKKKTTPQSGV